jgi:hypothetical protein
MHPDDLKALTGPKIRKYIEQVNRIPNFEWTLKMLHEGRIPAGSPVTQPEILAKYPKLLGYEHLEQIGVPGYTYVVPFLRAKPASTMEEFYSLDLMAEEPSPSVSQSSQPSTPLRVRYMDEAPPRGKKAKPNVIVDDEDEGDAKTDLQEPPSASFSSWKSWPSFSLCHKGDYAVIKIDYSGKGGISVLKVSTTFIYVSVLKSYMKSTSKHLFLLSLVFAPVYRI